MLKIIWIIWFVFAAIFIVGEILTAGFFLLWFGIGAAVAGVLAILGFNAGWQWGAFIAVSGILFAISRRFAERFTQKQPPGIGADRFIGEVGVVLEEIDNIKNTGRVRIEKEEWRADSATGEIIKEGEKVKVVRMDGTHVVVKIIEEGG
jgi:membrane protein implicated in regulation of membrane protease activity